ncbi:family 43 glycosylhydrolase [Coprobacter sp.]
MKNIKNRLLTCIYAVLFFLPSEGLAKSPVKNRIVANPIDLNYRFRPEKPSRREAADPVIVLYKDKYYLFASKSEGYWSSSDLIKWNYIPCESIPIIEDYAPMVIELEGELYYTAGCTRFFKTSDPEKDNWKEIKVDNKRRHDDITIFKDDDGKVYFYWGCHDKKPIQGVEVDPKNNFKDVGEVKDLILHNSAEYGIESAGDRNEMNKDGYNEGATMTKYNGLYYLQYATPGTQFVTYADAVYVSENPLGPFTYMEDNPYSIKPGGFIPGAGHGHTFQDKYGNYWHVSTMVIAVKDWFERRLGLFPVYFGGKGHIYCHTVFTDFPMQIPDRKVDLRKNDLSVGWNLLSYKKKVTASSYQPGYEAKNAADENVKTWWASRTGKAGEWLQIDLGCLMTVEAVQVNISDYQFETLRKDTAPVYQYLVESSRDGKNWQVIGNRTMNNRDAVHELIVLDRSVSACYIRIKNTVNLDGGVFSLSGFRVFGTGKGDVPSRVAGFKAVRNSSDRRRACFSWDGQDETTGYVIRWGTSPEVLNNAVMVYGNEAEYGFFNRDSHYYFSIQPFNENGKGKESKVVYVE